MANQLSVALQVARINRNLMAVVDECEKDVFDTLFTQAALVAAEQRSLAPVDEGSPTPGALRESVRVEKSRKHPRRVEIKAGGITTRRRGVGGRLYDYARAVVFGTVNMPAFDFFFSVWRARKKAARAAVRASIKRSVRKVFK